jgi:hypothetical protein
MNKWIKVVSVPYIAICIAGSIQAQTDYLIENQRDVFILNNTSWGDTYIGKYTSDNDLLLVDNPAVINTNALKLTTGNAYVGYLGSASNNTVEISLSNSTWRATSLTIGATNNAGNLVTVSSNGTLEVESGIVISGATNGNGLVLNQTGTLFVKSDFDASMEGFFYGTNTTLKIGGELSGLNSVESNRTVYLTGASATWALDGNQLTVGGLSGSNQVFVNNNALVAVSNLVIGASGTTSNAFVIDTGARSVVYSNLSILGTGNSLQVTNGGWLEVEMDFDTSMAGFELQMGGGLEAHGNLMMDGISNGINVVLDGENAIWDRSGQSMNIGAATNGGNNSLTVQNDASALASNVTLGAFSDGNSLTIISNGLVQIDSIIIGATNSADNAVVVSDGGTLILDSTNSFINADNSLLFENGGKLVVEQDFRDAITWTNDGHFTWGYGGILEAHGEAPVFPGWIDEQGNYIEDGRLFLNNGKTLILNGTNARWSASAFNLHIGDLSFDNQLIVTNGAEAFVNSASIGDFKEWGHNNHIIITGTNSLLDSASFVAIGGTMQGNQWVEGGISNSITVGNGGLLDVGTTLHNRNTTGTGGLAIKPGGVVAAQDYYQANGAYLNIYTDASGTNSGLLSVQDTAEFETGAQLGFDAIAKLTINRAYTNLIVESDTLIVGGVTNASTTDLANLDMTGGSLVNYELRVEDQDIYAYFTRTLISETGDFGPMITAVLDEIDRLSGLGNSAASNQVEILNTMGTGQIKEQMEQLYAYEIPSFMHNQGIFGGIDQVRARGSAFHNTRNSGSLRPPKGAAGPHSSDQGLQGWLKVYGGYGDRDKDDGTTFMDGYDLQSYGTVIGFDQAFGEWLFGLAGGYAGTMLEGENGDESDGSTTYGLFYASYGTKDWYGDIVLSYGKTDMDNTSGTAFDVTSNVEASQTAFFIGGGKEIQDTESDALLHPLIGLQISLYDQDAYTEQSTTAVAKDVAAYDRWSYQSILGASILIPTAGKTVDHETELRAFWMHEFNEDEEIVDYTLVGSSQPGQFMLRSPDQNVVQLGIGYLASWKNGLKLRADLDGQISETFYSATISGALLYEF